VTGLAKTHIVCTKTEIYFIALANNYTQEVSMHSVSAGPDELVCFSWWLFYRPVKSWVSNWHRWRAPIGCCGPEISPSHVRHLFSTVEWVGITVATFMADFWLRVHYGVCFILLLPFPPHPTLLPPTHPHATLVLKLVPTWKNLLKSR